MASNKSENDYHYIATQIGTFFLEQDFSQPPLECTSEHSQIVLPLVGLGPVCRHDFLPKWLFRGLSEEMTLLVEDPLGRILGQHLEIILFLI